jgi:hypothetical protein
MRSDFTSGNGYAVYVQRILRVVMLVSAAATMNSQPRLRHRNITKSVQQLEIMTSTWVDVHRSGLVNTVED